MVLILYNILFTFFLLLYAPYCFVRGLFRKRFRRLLAERLGSIPNLRGRSPVWIHAASVGEVICSVPLVRKIKEEFPQVPLLLTTMTPTGNSTAKQLIPEAEVISFFPLDHPLTVRRAIGRIGPRLLLLAETELWPNLLRTCGKEQIPVFLFNGRISKKSLKGYLSLKSLFGDALQFITRFLMQTEGDRGRIVEIGAPPDRVKVVGNMKFDQALPSVARGGEGTMARSLGLRGEEILLIAGSTHAGEEEILLGLFKELRSAVPNFFLLLAPRHLDRLDEVEKTIKKEGLSWTRKSALSTDRGQPVERQDGVSPVILLDTMGELMRLYSLGTLVFVGGSLVPVGGHNPLEPLAFKKCVLFGPYMFNFSEISRRLVESGGAVQVDGRGNLLFQMKSLLTNEKRRREIGEKGYQFLQKHRGATEKTFEEIRPFLSRK